MTSSSETCPHCGKRLEVRNFALAGHMPIMVTMPCDCPEAKAEIEREEAEAERAERIEAFGNAWRRVGIPQMFAHVNADFERVKPLFDGRWLYLYGDNGRGKTHAACQTAKAYLARNTYRMDGMMRCWKTCLFVTQQSLFSQLRASWDRWDQNEEDVFMRWAGVDLLILDDLGKGVPSEWAAENLFRLIDSRWSNGRLTVITSQYDLNGLTERYAKAGDETMSAMVSRLGGVCEQVLIDGRDRRTS